VEEAIKEIVKLSKEADPAKKGVNVVIKRGSERSGPSKLVTLNLTDVPVATALKYVTDLAGGTLAAEPNAYVISL
jgi:hypothetical protein